MLREEEPRNMACIHRNKPTTDETPPWDGITFVFPVGSDLLADHLKHAYPFCKNLRQRKHQAAIHFLTLELEEMRLRDGEQSILSEIQIDHPFGSPKSASNDLVDNTPSSSQQNTPSCASPTTPHSIQSPKLTDRSRAHTDQHAALEAQKPVKPDRVSSVQTFVFSAVDGRPHQPKTKRKMTIEERVLYKERRKRGACTKCKRMKGRCTHLGELEVQDCKETAPAIISDPDHGRQSAMKDPEGRTKRRSPPVPDDASGEESAKAQKGEWSLSARLRSPEIPDNADCGIPMQPHREGPGIFSNPQHAPVAENLTYRDGIWNVGEGQGGDDQFSPPSSISSNMNGSSSSSSPTPTPTNTAATTPASTTLV